MRIAALNIATDSYSARSGDVTLQRLPVAARVFAGAAASALVAVGLCGTHGASAVAVAVAGSITVAAGFAWLTTADLRRRARQVALRAAQYRAGDFASPLAEYANDELGAAVTALETVLRDVGPRLRARERDSERMQAVLAAMSEGVLVVDADGRLRLANKAARRTLCVGEVAIGRPYAESMRHPAIVELLASALQGSCPGPLMFSPGRDASRTILARAAATGEHAAVDGAVLVLHDITELRRADQIRRDFVANISHELRTPLTAIRGYVEALSEPDVDEVEQQRFVGVIARQTTRMERLVDDLLRLARLDAGQETLELSWCDIDAIIQVVVNDVAPMLADKRQQIVKTIEPGAERVAADAAKLHDILRNLVTNAVAYSPERTTITIAVASARDACRTISVTDEGPGIPEGDLHRVFERFYRVDKSRARNPGGTGLGLAIVKHLVELHGGEVAVRNRPTGGTVFSLTLDAERFPLDSAPHRSELNGGDDASAPAAR